jgi:hypothetical protein
MDAWSEPLIELFCKSIPGKLKSPASKKRSFFITREKKKKSILSKKVLSGLGERLTLMKVKTGLERILTATASREGLEMAPSKTHLANFGIRIIAPP